MRISDWSSDVCSSDLVAGGMRGQRGNAGLMAELPAPEAVLRNALGPDTVEVGIHAGRGGHGTGFLSCLAGILHGVPQQADRIVALQSFYMDDTMAYRALRIVTDGSRSEEHTSE